MIQNFVSQRSWRQILVGPRRSWAGSGSGWVEQQVAFRLKSPETKLILSLIYYSDIFILKAIFYGFLHVFGTSSLQLHYRSTLNVCPIRILSLKKEKEFTLLLLIISSVINNNVKQEPYNFKCNFSLTLTKSLFSSKIACNENQILTESVVFFVHYNTHLYWNNKHPGWGFLHSFCTLLVTV